MTTTERNVLINSSLTRISAALVTTIIHEMGHFLVSVGLGNSATLHHNYVETHTPDLPFIQQILIPAGGPVVSLLQGIVCMVFYRKIRGGVVALLVLWMGISGLMAFFGYMMIAPVFTVGDTGKIFRMLDIPILLQIIMAAGSLIFFTILLTRFHKDFERFIPEFKQDGKAERAKWAKLLIMYPVLIGIVITTIMQFPIVHFLSLLPSLMMPFMLFMVFGQMIMSKNKIEPEKNKLIDQLSLPLISGFVLISILYRFLVFGITI